MDWRQVVASVVIKREPYEANLIENVLIVGMILPENESNETGLNVVDVGLLEFPRLKVGVDIRIERYSPQFFPVIGLIDFDFEFYFGGYFALMGEHGNLTKGSVTLLMMEV